MSEANNRIIRTEPGSLTLPKELFDMIEDQVVSGSVHDEDYEFFSLYADKNAVFVDVGSNIGNSAVSIANRCPKAKIFGFEANKMLEPFLINESKRNQNYSFKLVGLGHQPGSMDLFIPIVDNSPILGEASVILSHFDDPVVVARLNSYSGGDDFSIVKSSCLIETLDQQSELFDAAGRSTHRVVKIDVEGAELSVLQGGLDFIQNFRPTFMIEDGGRPEIISFLADLGYSRYLVTHEDYSLREAVGSRAINSVFVHRNVF